MALKIALLAALCIAQGLAFQPFNIIRRKDICKDPAQEISSEFGQTIEKFDEVRESVSMAALEAYGRNETLEIVIACFKDQRENYLKLGLRISEMMESASQKMGQRLGEKAEKYAKLMEVPMKTIATTIRMLPEIVYNFIKNKEFFKAIEAIRNARLIVEENARIIGGIMQNMVAEVPELTEEAERMAREIREEAKKGMNVINQAFRKCVEEGGPKKSLAE